MKEKLFFTNSRGNKLCAILSNPTSDKGKPVIILCHGFATSKDGFTFTRLEKILGGQGISTFRFDFFGHGESEGKLEEITASEAVDDILKAVEFLKNKGYVKIGLVGSSFGGFASLTAASKTSDLYLLALKSPVSDYKGFISSHQNREEIEKWKKRGFMDYASADGQKIKINYAFFEDAEKITGYDAARKIKIPALIVHGDSDEAVPVGQSKKLATLIRSCSLKIIKGADHRYSKPEDFEKMLYLVSDFIIKNS